MKKLLKTHHGRYMDTKPVEEERVRKSLRIRTPLADRLVDLHLHNLKWKAKALAINKTELPKLQPRIQPVSQCEDCIKDTNSISDIENIEISSEDLYSDLSTQTSLEIYNGSVSKLDSYLNDTKKPCNIAENKKQMTVSNPRVSNNIPKNNFSFGSLNLEKFETWEEFAAYKPQLSFPEEEKISDRATTRPRISKHSRKIMKNNFKNNGILSSTKKLDYPINLELCGPYEFKYKFGTIGLENYESWDQFFRNAPPSVLIVKSNVIRYKRSKAKNKYLQKLKDVSSTNSKFNNKFENVGIFWDKITKGPTISPLAIQEVTYVPPSNGIFFGKPYITKKLKYQNESPLKLQ